MGNSAAAISPRELARLLERWGASRCGRNGGHDVYMLNGRRVQIPGAGRRMDVTYPVLRKAAKAACVNDIQTFLGGPQ